MNALQHIGAVIDEPLTAALERGIAIEGIGGHRRASEHGHKSDHGAGAYGETLVLFREKTIVEKSVVLVPERLFRIVRIIHGGSDVDVVLPEFTGHVLVDRIV